MGWWIELLIVQVLSSTRINKCIDQIKICSKYYIYFQNYCSRNQVCRFERSTDPPLLNLKSDLDYGRKYRF